MTKLCPRGKAAAKRKFKVYPSAYANAYASKICAGKIKDPSGVKRKDFKGPKKAMGGMIDFNKISQDRKRVSSFSQGGIAKGCGAIMANRRKKTKRPKQRRAVARNAQGVIMLQGEPSYSSNDQILIDELVFYIQQNDLKAD